MARDVQTSVPIAIFVYRRPELTALVWQEIVKAKPQKLYVFADGPKDAEDAVLVDQVRSITEQVDWDCGVVRTYSEKNVGLDSWITSSLDFLFKNESCAIVLEDDCLPSHQFFTFAEILLDVLEPRSDIAAIAGTNFAGLSKSEWPYFLAGHMQPWGWATWSDRWFRFRDFQTQTEMQTVSEVRLKKAVPGRFQRYLIKNLLINEPTLNAWDVAFFRWLYENELLCATPRQNLIENLGFGHLATHTSNEAVFARVTRSSAQLDVGSMRDLSDSINRTVDLEKHASRVMFCRLISHSVRHPIWAFRTLVYWFSK